MKINTKQAVKLFFSNPSLEMVYFEAIANSIDAEANHISLDLSIDAFNKPDTFVLKISDNGVGFTDERFRKFSKLLEVDEDSHKGVGRLVFLSYFRKIDVTSRYEHTERKFIFSNEFDEKSEVIRVDSDEQKTVLILTNYYLSKIKSHSYLQPNSLKKRILEEFYPRLYFLKQHNKSIQIDINLKVNKPNENQKLVSSSSVIDITDIEELQVKKFEAKYLSLFDKMELHYSIKQSKTEKNVITAICVDQRTYKIDIISSENIPSGYAIIFLLYSDFFKGKVNSSRQELAINESTLKKVKNLFREKVAEILRKNIPEIEKKNTEIKTSLANKYPHLLGYFETDTIGFLSRNDALNKAQEKFFKAQKEVLEASDYSDERYQKTLEMSSRTLTEYILYRQIIIEKLKRIDKENSEADIHELIVPMKKEFKESHFIDDIYSNNAWLLDDKFMTYSTILSDLEMSELINKITEEENQDHSRPDIAIVFSGNPKNKSVSKVDVVIIELKKKGIKLAKNEEVISQLRQRARRLMNYYGNKIQRIWFYGIVEFSEEFKMSLLEDDYIELYSQGAVYYKEINVMLDYKTRRTMPAGIYLLEMNSFIADADLRNSTFLKILKKHFINE